MCLSKINVKHGKGKETVSNHTDAPRLTQPDQDQKGMSKAAVKTESGVGPSRRTWDMQEYAQKAKERDRHEKELAQENEERMRKGACQSCVHVRWVPGENLGARLVLVL